MANTDQKLVQKYCCYCGERLLAREGSDTGDAHVWCSKCQVIHYQNPAILVATFLYCNEKLLWAKRGIEPYKGKWAFPAGYAECGESLQQAAARELFEETRIKVAPEQLIPMSISSIVAIDQIYVVFRCPCASELVAEVTEETLDWAWRSRDEAPWDEMAHKQSRPLVEQVYSALETQKYFMRVGLMGWHENRHQSYSMGSMIAPEGAHKSSDKL